MKTKSIFFLTVLFGLLSLTSCERWKCVEGSGNRLTETRNPGVFFGLESYNDCEINIVIDTTLSEPVINIEADENVLPYIKTEIQSENLIITTQDKKCLETDL